MASTEYIHLVPGAPLPIIGGSAPFRAVVIADEEASPEWQASVSEWLVKSGCLYMMAWGRSCSSWDDSVDFANMEEFAFGEIPEEKSVMTTWHANESLQEVFWFSKNSAAHPVVGIDRTLLVHISPVSNEGEQLKAYADA